MTVLIALFLLPGLETKTGMELERWWQKNKASFRLDPRLLEARP